jgi:hypothetical protein
MSVKPAGDFVLFELEDGGVAIAMGGVDVWYADDFDEANLFLTLIEAQPMLVTISGFLSKRLFNRRAGRELERLSIPELEEAPGEGDPS